MLGFTVFFLIPIVSLVVFSIGEMIYRWMTTSRGKLKIPTDTPLPLIGNGLSFIKISNLRELRETLFAYHRDSPLSGFWLFNQLIIFVNEPKYIEVLSSKSTDKPEEIYGVIEKLTSGIFVRNGHDWSKLRKPLIKLMHTGFIDQWIEVFSKKAEKLCKTIASHDVLTEFHKLCYQCSFEIVNETHFGLEKCEMVQGNDSFYEVLKKLLEDAFLEPFQIRKKIDVSSGPDKRCLNQGLQTMNSILNERREVSNSITSINDAAYYADVVLQVAKGAGFDDQQTSRLAIDMLVAGSDTNSAAISSAIEFLAMHPECQAKVNQEQFEIFDGSLRSPSYQDLNKMKYLDMIIFETLRHSGVPLIARRLTGVVDIDGYRLPANSVVLFRFMNVCRDPRWWERPSDFYPEHFLPEAVANRPKGAFSPFGRGPRSCPGNIYAMISIKVILSTILRRFKFTTDAKFEDVIYEYGLMQNTKAINLTAIPLVSKCLIQ